MIVKCHICMGPGEVLGTTTISCFRCGKYNITGDSAEHMASSDEQWKPAAIATASGWLRENQGVTIDRAMLDFLSSISPPPIAVKADKLLLYLSRRYPRPGQSIFENFWIIDTLVKSSAERPQHGYSLEQSTQEQSKRLLPYLSASWSRDQTELIYITENYLEKHKRFLEPGSNDGSFRITPAGWDHITNLSFVPSKSDDAFVAMWFDTSLNAVWSQGIAKGISESGYNPVRIDKTEHNNKIDDEIVAAIRRSRFLVADFTGQRGGVYFEAGLAAGLGKPVVWLCRRADLKDVHFDTRQYNFLLWDAEHPDELARGLQNRIEATIGRGRLS